MGIKTRMGGAIAVGAAVALVGATVAVAEPGVGQPGLQTDPIVLDYLLTQNDDGPIPVQFWAEGNNQCEVTFTVVNRTNSDSYLVDFIVDGEDPKTIEDDMSHPTYQFGTINKGPYKGTHVGDRTLGRRGVYPEPSGIPRGTPLENGKNEGLKVLNDPLTTTATIDLRDLQDLPNPEADAHTITYQQIGGPDHGIHGVQSDMPVFTTEVTGCADGGFWGSLEDHFGSGSAGSLHGISHQHHHHR